MTISASTIADLARRCYTAYQTVDRDEIERLLAPDFTFTSPYDDHIDRATYFERCWPNAGTFERFDVQDVVVQGNCCWVVYEGNRKGGGWFRNTEMFRIDGHQIASVEVFFGLPPHTPPSQPPAA
jgi:ketosteroid isomerase-like protein